MNVRLLRPEESSEKVVAPAFADASEDSESGAAGEFVSTAPEMGEVGNAGELGDCPPILPGNDTLDGLAKMAGVEKLAAQAGESVRPRDTLEELLTHELVAGHAFAMNVLCQANNQFLAVDNQAADFDHLTRLNQATAQTGMVGVHMMAAVQRGVLLLDRLRHGIRYHHVVERVDAVAAAGTPVEPGE